MSTRSNSGKSKHFDVKLRYVNELVERGKLILIHIPRGENCADILTHALKRTSFEKAMVLIYGPGVKDVLYGYAHKTGGETNNPTVYTSEFTEF